MREVGVDHVILSRVGSADEFTTTVPITAVAVGDTVIVYRDCSYEPCMGKVINYGSCGDVDNCDEGDLDYHWDPPESSSECIGAIVLCTGMFSLLLIIYICIVVI